MNEVRVRTKDREDPVSHLDTRSKHTTAFADQVQEKSMTPGFALGTAVLVFLAVLLSTETILYFREAEVTSQRTRATLAFASELRARTDRELNSFLYLGNGIVGYLDVNHGRLDANEVCLLSTSRCV